MTNTSNNNKSRVNIFPPSSDRSMAINMMFKKSHNVVIPDEKFFKCSDI